jgi:hypothetical protein
VSPRRARKLRSSGCDTGPSAADCDSAYFAAFHTFITSRRPTAKTFSSKAVSVPRRAESDQYRTASAPYWSRRCIGVTTFPLLFDIFLRSGSSTQPEMATLRQGIVRSCSQALTIV